MSLGKICKLHGQTLDKLAPWMDGEVCLQSLASVESNYGLYNIPKHERAYDQGGIYFNKQQWARWGALAACSYSSWQIMYPVCVELGFTGSPLDLMQDEIAIYWVIEYIDRRIIQKGCSKLQDFADAYNSGSFRDKLVPTDYITKFMKYYIDLHQSKYGDTLKT